MPAPRIVEKLSLRTPNACGKTSVDWAQRRVTVHMKAEILHHFWCPPARVMQSNPDCLRFEVYKQGDKISCLRRSLSGARRRMDTHHGNNPDVVPHDRTCIPTLTLPVAPGSGAAISTSLPFRIPKRASKQCLVSQPEARAHASLAALA